MGKQSWTAADVRCPFYKGDDHARKTVLCEGHVEGMTVQMIFRRLDQKQNYMGLHCCGGYQRCEIYKATMTKYPADF